MKLDKEQHSPRRGSYTSLLPAGKSGCPDRNSAAGWLVGYTAEKIPASFPTFWVASQSSPDPDMRKK